LWQSSTDSPEQRHRGEEDPIHPPLLYFLVIVIFDAAKEIIVTINTSLPSHLFACLHAILLLLLLPP
jgi:hypothetical protein